MKKMPTLFELFLHELKDVASAEGMLVEALPKLAEAANSDDLRGAIENHLEETRQQRNTIHRLLDGFGSDVGRTKCVAMAGIIEEGQKLMKEKADESVRDAAIIASAQKAEHYEIATYGTLRAWAEQLGLEEAAATLDVILEEESAANETLTQIARRVNQEAEAGGQAKR
jgi:ferritin-like metal-binding protein YciE